MGVGAALKVGASLVSVDQRLRSGCARIRYVARGFASPGAQQWRMGSVSKGRLIGARAGDRHITGDYRNRYRDRDRSLVATQPNRWRVVNSEVRGLPSSPH